MLFGLFNKKPQITYPVWLEAFVCHAIELEHDLDGASLHYLVDRCNPANDLHELLKMEDSLHIKRQYTYDYICFVERLCKLDGIDFMAMRNDLVYKYIRR